MYSRLEALDVIQDYIQHHVAFMGNAFKYSKNTRDQKLFENLSILL